MDAYFNTDYIRFCCVCSKKKKNGFISQGFVWGDRSWPIRARLRGSRLRRAGERERGGESEHERERNPAASRVTDGQI